MVKSKSKKKAGKSKKGGGGKAGSSGKAASGIGSDALTAAAAQPAAAPSGNATSPPAAAGTTAASAANRAVDPSLTSPLDDDPRFLREYSKNLADALRANERLPPPPPSKLVHATYRALCHDDPRVDGPTGGDSSCRLLAERLVDDAFGPGSFFEGSRSGVVGGGDGIGGVTSSMSGMTMKRRGGGTSTSTSSALNAQTASGRPQSRLVVPTMSARNNQDPKKGDNYALSDRLIGGILQATDRTPAPASTSTATGTNKDGDDQKEKGQQEKQEPEGFASGPAGGQPLPATPAGYADLAYASLVRGPALCCRPSHASNLDRIRAFLGSYGGHIRVRSADADGDKSGGVDGGGDDDDDKDVASKWEDDMLEKAAEAYIQGMIDMGKISGGDGKASILPPTAEDEKKDSKGDEDKEEEWDSIGDGSSSSSSSSGFFRNQAQRIPPSDGPAADTNSLEEIFAEESDPDDFEYESNHDPAAELAAAVLYIEESFDPHHLSQRNTQMNWDGARDRLTALVDELAYNRLLHLSKSRWKALDASETLIELTRTLLDADIANDPGSSSSRPTVIKTETLLRRPTHLPPSASLSALTAQWSKPLAALRDRALDETYCHDVLEAYIDFVKSLLNAPASRPCCVASNSKANPCKVVGLASLSSLCGYDGVLRTKSGLARHKVRESVIDSVDGIIDIVEGIRQPICTPSPIHTGNESPGRDLPSAYIADDDAKDSNATKKVDAKDDVEWIRGVVGLLPVLQFLTNTQLSDYDRLDWSDASATLSQQEAQSLLNTGLFRELILLQAAAASDQKDGAVAATRNRLLRAVFVLSAQSVSVLGKYATRVPELASKIHSTDFMETNLVDATLWAALSSSLQSPTQSNLRLRGVGALPSIDKLNGDCLRGFTTLCERVDDALKSMISNAKDRKGDNAEDSGHREIEDAPYQFVEFTNCIANLPAVSGSWVNATSSIDGGTEKALERLEAVRKTLALIPIKKASARAPVHGKDHEVKCGDVDKAEKVLSSSSAVGAADSKSTRVNDEIVASIRKGIKIVSLLLEAGPSHTSGAGVGNGENLAPRDVSSKTD